MNRNEPRRVASDTAEPWDFDTMKRGGAPSKQTPSIAPSTSTASSSSTSASSTANIPTQPLAQLRISSEKDIENYDTIRGNALSPLTDAVKTKLPINKLPQPVIPNSNDASKKPAPPIPGKLNNKPWGGSQTGLAPSKSADMSKQRSPIVETVRQTLSKVSGLIRIIITEI